ncbi:hypothetical protein P5673_014354 [Acropora cervicornis]|uniref:DNA-directed DNA polymerase n=1 Tax=Acropora cervicornis TaxID=6130 RepID=A0AAD9QJU1_ACRCE|nr:hypothetical protein P5673_014354 [Acropora cervicornis]
MTLEDCLQEQERTLHDSSFEYSWALPRIRHAHNGGEIRLLTARRYTCDGFDAQTNTVYEFNGCFWHGCPMCFPNRTEPHARLCDLTMDDVYQTHQQKLTTLRQAVQGDEQIRYYDFKSLYPHVNKYCPYPVGHPTIITQPSIEHGLAHWFGVAPVTILLPRDLYHPVLHYRCKDKLIFPLCAACVDTLVDAPLLQKVQYVCDHAPCERALTGT